MPELHAVTGAFGYTGKYITRLLLAEGYSVRTLTNSPNRNHEFSNQIEIYPFNFDQPELLTESLRDVKVLYNTYWVRYHNQLFDQVGAVENTRRLFIAAKAAGVQRIVHLSITNPSKDSPYDYFRLKAYIEEDLINTGLSYAILRPTVIFGIEDILINNIAWLLRLFPVFCTFGNGDYYLQPIFIEDLARLAVDQGKQERNCIVNAIGPETFTYRQLVETISNLIGVHRKIYSLPPAILFHLSKLFGKLVGDQIITEAEIAALMQNYLFVETQPVGITRFSDWAAQNSSRLGNLYHSEITRRTDQYTAYDQFISSAERQPSYSLVGVHPSLLKIYKWIENSDNHPLNVIRRFLVLVNETLIKIKNRLISWVNRKRGNTETIKSRNTSNPFHHLDLEADKQNADNKTKEKANRQIDTIIKNKSRSWKYRLRAAKKHQSTVIKTMRQLQKAAYPDSHLRTTFEKYPQPSFCWCLGSWSGGDPEWVGSHHQYLKQQVVVEMVFNDQDIPESYQCSLYTSGEQRQLTACLNQEDLIRVLLRLHDNTVGT